jgi:DnaJ-class molecular chaperone
MTKEKNEKQKVTWKKCLYCSGKGRVLHMGGIEHGTYDQCPSCLGRGTELR